MMKLYNTATKKIETVKPLNLPTATIYTCGPTVYDYPHIGNWFTFVRYDMLVRTITMAGYEPKWVMNITDVGHLVSDADEGEDKLEKGARREGKTAWDVANFYVDYFVRGIARLNMSQPNYLPKATLYIPDQIDLIRQLEAKGYTYIIDDGVYYDTSKFKDYGKLAQLDLDEQQASDRVAVNAQKRQPSDFALWKFSPETGQRDMEWDSPWGVGFPGWHLECSAMSMKFLGPTIDIHSGGIDHIPTHHTNEIAQSEAITGKPLAQIWMHTNHIMIEGEKIAKSLGNSITLEDIEAKGFTLEDLRLLILESHYRTQSKFSWDSLAAGHSRLQTYLAFADLRWQPSPDDTTTDFDFATPQKAIHTALQNDIGTPQALAILSQTAQAASEHIPPARQAEAFERFLTYVDMALGLKLIQTADITDDQKDLLAQRQKARDAKDFEQSDKLRDELTNQGISVRDTSDGPIWSHV